MESTAHNDKYAEGSYNIGLQLLRAVMCFRIVVGHLGEVPKPASAILQVFYAISSEAVPIFMMIAFYFAEKGVISKSPSYAKKRLDRIAWPHIGWAIIYFAVYKLFSLFMSMGETWQWNRLVLKDLGKQLLIGTPINPSMWFQVVLFWITVFYILFFWLLPQKGGIMLITGSAFLALFMQYSGLNYKICSDLGIGSHTVGRVCEMIPYAALGFGIAYYRVLDKLSRHRVIAMVGIVGLGLLIKILPDGMEIKGFDYGGIHILLISLCLLLLAYLAPLHMLPQKLKRVLLFISRYTLGIYCGHRLLGTIFEILGGYLGVEISSYLLCITIYVMLFILGFLADKSPFKLVKNLFS